jgi:formylmethanofuran dehydrogenase subunit C
MRFRSTEAETINSRMAVGKRFGGYRPEDEKSIRKADVKENIIHQLMSAWIAFDCNSQTGAHYEDAVSVIKGLQYSAKNVEEFSIALVQFQEEHFFGPKAGLFLSALINEGEDEDYIIHTKQMGGNVTCLGLYNTKNVTVIGNLAFSTGEHMKGGRLLVKGDVGAGAGQGMEGGTIEIEGNADNSVGCWMRGGAIVIHGDAGYNVGVKMKGGKIAVNGNIPASGYDDEPESWGGISGSSRFKVGNHMDRGDIHINGDYPKISGKVFKGKIFHKGKLISRGNELPYRF